MSLDTFVFILVSSTVFIVSGLAWVSWRDRHERQMREAQKWDRIPLP